MFQKKLSMSMIRFANFTSEGIDVGKQHFEDKIYGYPHVLA